MKLFRNKKIPKLLRIYRHLSLQVNKTLPLVFQKRSCSMLLHFTSKNYSDFETADDFMSVLESALKAMCKSNNLEFDGVYLLDSD